MPRRSARQRKASTPTARQCRLVSMAYDMWAGRRKIKHRRVERFLDITTINYCNGVR